MILNLLNARAFSNFFFNGVIKSSISNAELSQRLQVTKLEFRRIMHTALDESGTEDMIVQGTSFNNEYYQKVAIFLRRTRAVFPYTCE